MRYIKSHIWGANKGGGAAGCCVSFCKTHWWDHITCAVTAGAPAAVKLMERGRRLQVSRPSVCPSVRTDEAAVLFLISTWGETGGLILRAATQMSIMIDWLELQPINRSRGHRLVGAVQSPCRCCLNNVHPVSGLWNQWAFHAEKYKYSTSENIPKLINRLH